jgi:energy-coupling factor transporter ATP-binding protein EcfA2
MLGFVRAAADGTVTVVVLIGASGAGKTTIARAVAGRRDVAAKVFHFDSIGIPPVEDMVRECGSGEAWQRARTLDWMARLAGEAQARARVLFEGQTRFSFLAEGAAAAGGLAYQAMLVDCDDATRARRLRLERNQPDLADDTMMDWARYLRREAVRGGHPILDTSALSLAESVERVLARLGG